MGKRTNSLLKLDNDPIKIQPYRGYIGEENLYLKGRILKDEDVVSKKTDRRFRNFMNTLKRFKTDEISNAKIRVKFNSQEFICFSDREGYFSIDHKLDTPLSEHESKWIPFHAEIIHQEDVTEFDAKVEGEVFQPSISSEFGIITDVDDTILQTHVTSLFKVKMLYATFFKNAHQRLPMEGMSEIMNLLSKGNPGKAENPVFYVSHSPWNIYDLIEKFLHIQKFPKGPILLRDYGLKPSGSFKQHKTKTIMHILQYYPKLPFIFLGDSAEEDTDYYLRIAKQYPDRVKGIFIRDIGNSKNGRRVQKLIEKNSDINVFLIRNAEEIKSFAEGLRLIH